MRKALLTGATGFIGSHLRRHLLANGWKVLVLVRETSETRGFEPSVEVIVDKAADTDTSALSKELKRSNPDVVFHLASLFLAAHQPSDVSRLIESNVTFGTRLLEAMRAAGVKRFINTGSAWQHFENTQVPVNLYAATKSAFDAVVDYYSSAFGIHAISLELFDTYGENDPRAKLVHLLLKTAKSGEHLGMSKGEQRINLVHVDDVVKAYSLAADRLLSEKSVKHEKFVVSNTTTPTLRELVALFEKSTGSKLDIGWGERPYRDREVMAPYSKGATLPGWKPGVTLEAGFRSLFESSSETK